MNQIATITSKKQLTIPVAIFNKIGLRIGQKVLISEDNGNLLITPAEKLVEELAGILTMPKEWKNKTLNQVIEDSKKEYFRNHKK
jgi:bifunctional DNA-binding transcriptional regulator/antitoxin component of YhaV-PrlF toxin-antitoxin module